MRRPRARDLIKFGGLMAARFGTRFGRRSRLWRAPAAAIWTGILLLTMPRLWIRGNAIVLVTPLPPPRHWTVRAGVTLFAAGIAAAFGALMTYGVVKQDITLIVVMVLFAFAAVEFVPSASRAVTTPDRSAALHAAIEAAGHTGPIWSVDLFAGAGDGALLGAAVLAHADRHDAALVATARDERLARLYQHPRAGFSRVAEDQRTLFRLPRREPGP